MTREIFEDVSEDLKVHRCTHCLKVLKSAMVLMDFGEFCDVRCITYYGKKRLQYQGLEIKKRMKQWHDRAKEIRDGTTQADKAASGES